MKHLFVINPKSFRMRSDISALEKEIAGCFAVPNQYDIHISRYPRDAVGIVSKYAARATGGLRVYAVGGDGILFDCLNGIIGYPHAELAAVPYGSTNDFARAISPGDLEERKPIKPLLTAPSVLTDVIHCGSNYYLNFCAAGVESAAIAAWYKMQERFGSIKSKWLVNTMLTFCGALSIFNKELVHQYYEVAIDGRSYDGHYAVINFSNGPCYGGDKTVFPNAIFNDGRIDVLLIKSTGRLKLLSLIPGYLSGQYAKYPDCIEHVEATEIFIYSEKPMSINLDGECFLDTHIALRIMPSAVKMIAAGGRAFEGEKRS